jgi:hypothetical protein
MINIRLHYSPTISRIGNDTINHDVVKLLRGLKNAATKNADVDMQNLYPEGYVFFNALYGLAWCNFLEHLNTQAEQIYYDEGRTEIQNCWNKINSTTGHTAFNEELPLAYGAFYTGWSSYLLGKKLSIEQPLDRDENEIIQFKRDCERIHAALQERIYPVSYYGGAWPADVVVCVASLSLHDKLFPVKYTNSIAAWLGKVKTKLDSHGLIPHAVHPLDYTPTENARGSSQSLMLIFLKDINADFARQQFQLYKNIFVDNKLGLTGIREYPKDEFGIGDVDSGPVVLQLGTAATIVGMHTMHLYKENNIATDLRNMIEGVGFPLELNERKIYLFGLLPMADAFIVWGHSALAVNEIETSFAEFHLYSSIAGLIFASLLWLFLRRKPSSGGFLHIPW